MRGHAVVVVAATLALMILACWLVAMAERQDHHRRREKYLNRLKYLKARDSVLKRKRQG